LHIKSDSNHLTDDPLVVSYSSSMYEKINKFLGKLVKKL